MKTTTKVLLVASLLGGCSSTPEATEAETTATAAAATATADMVAPETTAVASAAETAAPAPPPPELAADLVVTPVKISVDPKTVMELKADKGIYVGTKKIGSFDKSSLKVEGMNDSMTVLKDGTIDVKPTPPKKMKFNEKDEIEIEGGGKIAIDDKGKVTMVAPDNKPAPKGWKAPVIAGFKPEGRRAASLGLLLVLFSTPGDAAPPPPPVERSASPKTSAAPQPKSTAPTMK